MISTVSQSPFAWGNVQLLLTLRQGQVDELDVYSDAIDAELVREIHDLLLGVKYGSRFMADALFVSEKSQIRELAEFILSQDL